MGIVPGWAAATHLVYKVGYHRALNILLSGAAVNSDYASSIGLIDYIIEMSHNDLSPIPDEILLEKGVELIDGQIGKLTIDVVKAMKNVTFNASRLPYADSLANEIQVFKSLWGAPANQKALLDNLKHA